jgi:CspA family cold shock protein
VALLFFRRRRGEAGAVRKERVSMQEGVVKWFNEKKNYGFIESNGQEDIFFHGSSIADHGFFGLAKSDRVTFDVKETQRGRQAVNVKVMR